MIVSDRDEIMKLIEKPSDMKLKTTSHSDDARYHMFFKTSTDKYLITMGKDGILYVEREKLKF